MSDLLYYILLSTVKGIGYSTFNKIIEINSEKNIGIKDFFGLDYNDIIETYSFLKPSIIEELNNKEKEIENIKKLYDRLVKKNFNVISIDDKNYPQTLKETLKNNSPPLLYYTGNVDILNNKSIAVVGSRKASDLGLNLSFQIAKNLAENGYTVVSGFANGIDEKAHLGALSSSGYTILVLSYGIFKFTNYQQNKLLKDYPECYGNYIAISEYYPDTQWKDGLALNRNKTICGIGESTILVEGRNESGSDNTANLTLNYNKNLYVVEYDNYNEANSANKKYLSTNNGNIKPLIYKLVNDKPVINFY